MLSFPVALTIAGSDSGGGAGIQADLKTFEAHGVFGTCALTLITAQNTQGVRRVAHLAPQLVREQLQAVLDDFPVTAIKTGALGRPDVLLAVAEVLREYGAAEGRWPLVVDPVMLAKSGDALLDAEALQVLVGELLPLATLVTPNVPEWQALRAAGACETLPLLLKGGHTLGNTVTDELRTADHFFTFTAPRCVSRHTHGTGCTLSAAITAHLACGRSLPEAVKRAHTYVQLALRRAPGLGAGHGPLGFSSGLS